MQKFIVPAAIVVVVVVLMMAFGIWPFSSDDDKESPELHREVKTRIENDADRDVETSNDDVSTDAAKSDTDDQDAGPKPDDKSDADKTRAAMKRLDELEPKDPAAFRSEVSRRVLDRSTSREQRRQWRERLDRHLANPRLVKRGWKTVSEKVVPGDGLIKIARRVKKAHGNNVTAAVIRRMNGLRSDLVRVGQRLKVPTETLSVLTDKGDFRLYVLLGDTILCHYPVGVGKDNSTPEGKFIVRGKTKNPDWTMPDSRVVPYGDPDHIIGSRWMGFENETGRTSYGIHGTIDDASVGKSVSEGCIRMLKADVEELFELAPEGCSVSVRE